jgi:hypothetical protein
VKTTGDGDGRWRVATDPDGVTIGTEVSVAGMEVVVVPPDGVRTDETTTDEATGTVVVPPFEVSTVAEVTDDSASGVLTTDEAETGTVTVAPLGVVTTWVTYGELNPGVETVTVAPYGVVTVSVTGDGRWRVAVDPLEVTTWTEVSLGATVSVVVPPETVRTCETTGDEAREITSLDPYELTTERVGTGEAVKDEAEMEVTSTPDEVIDGVLEDGAGVYTVVVAPDGVV